uniref:Uncharacterized protein n=1 Tax=Anopheles melas TaxID=34690 RepID=A0A182TWX8_9DIPT
MFTYTSSCSSLPRNQSLSRWHKQLSSSTTAAHGEKSCRRSRASAAVPTAPDQRLEETIFFYGGLVNRSDRNAYSPLDEPLLLLHAAAPPDDEAAGWLNTTTTMLCSPGASVGAADASTDAAWWSPGKGRMDVGRTSATTAPGCRNEFDKATSASFSGAEASITVHDVCNKSGGSGSSNGGSGRHHDSSGGCGGQFSSGARSHVAPGSCSGGGTAAAATPAGAPAAVRLHQPTSIISPKKPCDYSSIISVRSSSSNSNRGGGGGGRPYGGGPGSITFTTTTNTALSTALSPPTPPPSLLLPDIDWTNETCLGGAGTDHDFTNTIVDGPASHHLWLR